MFMHYSQDRDPEFVFAPFTIKALELSVCVLCHLNIKFYIALTDVCKRSPPT